MAFETKKIQVHRIIGSMSCGCAVEQEFSDPRYKEQLTEPAFTACERHGKDSETIKFIMEEFLSTEINRVQNSAPTTRGAVEGTDKDGNKIVLQGSGQHRPKPKVRTANTSAVPTVPTQNDIDPGGAQGSAVDAMLSDGSVPIKGAPVDDAALANILDGEDPSEERTVVPEEE